MSPNGQLSLCCPCGSLAVEIAGLCKSCYRRLARDKARFGGLRERVIARDHQQYRVCGGRKLLVVHHRRPRHTYDNLVTLCAACHARLHRLEGMKRWIPPALVELWVEQHPDVAIQRQFVEFVGL